MYDFVFKEMIFPLVYGALDMETGIGHIGPITQPCYMSK